VPGAGGDAERGVRPGGDDLVQGDGGAAAADAVDGADRPGDPVQVAGVFATTCVRMTASRGGVAHRDDSWHRQEARQMAGSVWLTHRDMNATSS